MPDPILQPLQLRHLRLKNRIMSNSHEPSYSHEGMPKLQYQLYHESKAKGGLALTMFGGSACVSPESPSAFGNLRMERDEIIPWLQQFSERIHQHDVALMCQLTHLGRRGDASGGDWLPLLAPSPLREPAHRSFPKQMEDFDFKRVARDFAAAAVRCKEGGLDGVEIMASGHLVDSFLSPLTNKRSDAYGGSLANRARFVLEVFNAVRAAVGDDYIVGTRMVFDECLEGGLRPEESLEVARMIHNEARLDFITVNQGHIDTDAGLAAHIPGMGTPAAPFLNLVKQVKAELQIATFHAGRIQDLATARHALNDDCLDMVGMVRAHIAEPAMVNKVNDQAEHRIRPCVGAGYCIDRIYVGHQALCIHNAATGREEFMQHDISRSAKPGLKAVVVGAGPAGLEAARVLALRGHHVEVYEANSDPGGQISIAARASRRKELIGIVDWRVAELAEMGVEVQCNQYLEAEDVLAKEPDVVIVATGGLPNIEFFDGGGEHALSTWDVFSGSSFKGSVIVYDDNGSHQGYSAAEHLMGMGASVHLVTPERSLAPDVGGINYPAYLRALHKHQAQISLNSRIHSVAKASGTSGYKVNFRNEYTSELMELHCDHLVVEHGTLPLADIYFDLKPHSINLGEVDQQALMIGAQQQLRNNERGRFQLYRLGDAIASSNIHGAIFDAARICQNL